MSLTLATCGYLTDEPVGTAPLPPPAPVGLAHVALPPPPPKPTGAAIVDVQAAPVNGK